MKIKTYLIFFLLFIANISFSNEFIKIDIIGNKRISNETIINIINFKKNESYDLDDLNDFQKKLLKSNFFSDVLVQSKSKTLIIEVKENPLIDFFYIKGVENKKREDFLYEILSLGQNRVFSDVLLNEDLEKIRDVFRSAGYFDVLINPIVTKTRNGTYNVVLEIDRKNKYNIKRIFFIGDVKYKSSTLLDVVSSTEYGWWNFLSDSDIVDSNRINIDKELLKDFYLKNGYYDVQIVSSDINIVDNKSANIIFSINAGEKYFFSEHRIIDNGANLKENDLSSLNKILSKKINGTFSKTKIDNADDLINDYLISKKIEFVTFLSTPKKNNTNSIDVEYNFIQIPKKFINLVNVSGNSITEENVIRRNMLFSEGDSFVDYKIKKTIDNLKSLKIFKSVNLTTENISDNKLDINISVEEQPTGSIGAGIGVGSSGSAISTSLVEQNLFGKGIILNSNITVGTEKIFGNTSFTIPDFKNSGNNLNYNIYAVSTEYQNAGYESKKIGNSVSLNYDIYEDVSLTSGVGADVDQIDTNNSASALYKSREGDYLTFKTFYSIFSDKRDSKFLPTKGYRIGFGQSYAIPGSDIPYIENNLSGSYYYPIAKDYILSLKSGISSINSLDNKDVKLSDRKFLSGSKLRGFESFGIGPKDGKDHIGGNYSAYTSLSTTIPNPIPDSWNAKSILFLDSGNVWGVDYNNSLDSNKIRSSAGLSLEWISPLGPLSITMAQNISKADGDLDESFSFNIGSNFWLLMKSFFRNKGPFDINFILENLLFSEKKKFRKFKIKNVSNLKDSLKGDITFLDSNKYFSQAEKTKASFCLTKEKYSNKLNLKCVPIISKNPLLDFIIITKLFYPESINDNYKFKLNQKYKNLKKLNTFIDSSVKIGTGFDVGINTVLKKNVILGKNVTIGSNCVISNSVIGDNVKINDGTIIGKIGYGFKYINNKFNFIPHIGSVIINNNVYIGSNCTIDRGSFSNTVIDHDTKIDNLVHLAHNVKVGSNCFVAGQVGIAGSTIIGDNCIIGGQAGISGHLKIGSNVKIGGHSGVIRDIEDDKKVMGYPSKDIKLFLKKELKLKWLIKIYHLLTNQK